MSYHPELGNNVTWTPLDISVPHFGNPDYSASEKKSSPTEKPKYINKAGRRKKIAGWNRK